MKFDKKDNIFKNLWFNFVVVPTLIFVWTIIAFFSSDFNTADKDIMTYLSIGLLAFFAQMVLMMRKSIKHHSNHYLYILISINISLFLGYFINKFIVLENVWWKSWLINPLIAFVIVFAIKTIIWYILAWNYHRKLSQDQEVTDIRLKNQNLENEISDLKTRLSWFEEHHNPELRAEEENIFVFSDYNQETEENEKNGWE